MRVFSVEFAPTPHVLIRTTEVGITGSASEALLLNLFLLELLDLAVVELEPLVILLDVNVGIIVPEFGGPEVDNDPDEFIFIIIRLVQSKLLEIELGGELEPGVDFLILQGVQVEDEPLEVQDKHVGQTGEQLPLGDVNLLGAGIAPEIADDLALDVLLEALVEIFEVLDGKRKIVELLLFIADVIALGAS